jgi:cellulose synthase/poly-beta-1,6-N-acetylglucosamine synthase-like glycosyltransferase
MCFTTRVLASVPYDAFSVVEDVEYGIRLGQAGHRVEYAAEAHVYGEMVSSELASRSQRHRWEGGRAALARTHALSLLRRAIARRDLLLFDLAADILVPPLGTLVGIIAMGLLAALGAYYAEGRPFAFWIWLANLVAVLVYVLRGWSLSGTGVRGLVELGLAPFYLAWKVWLRLRQPRASGEWVRTTREPQPEAPVAVETPPVS